jgi:toxin secretion/phage lysis holin
MLWAMMRTETFCRRQRNTTPRAIGAIPIQFSSEDFGAIFYAHIGQERGKAMGAKMALSTIWTAAAGSTGKEAAFGGLTAFGGLLASALGGWDTALKVLVALMVADYVTGVLGALKINKRLDLDVMFWGGVRKGILVGVIAIAAMCDSWVGGNSPIFRTLAIYFYAGREGLSVVKNLGPLGVYLPPALVGFLEQLKQKGEDGNDANKKP